ncbi:MAG: GTP-binding protein [Candidatus Lokiarchaeota archaeon]|nr:GTP-binding protein [Candidatus Lokiarchaeota archaeon]
MTNVKTTFIGYPHVGKSTLLALLKGKMPDLRYKPTMLIDFESLNFGDHSVKIWDIGGQASFEPYWDQFVENSILNIVVCDSTPKNVLKTKMIIEKLEKAQQARTIAIANKQDIDGHMSAKRVENVLGVRTYPMVAIDFENKDRLYYILIRELLESMGVNPDEEVD